MPALRVLSSGRCSSARWEWLDPGLLRTQALVVVVTSERYAGYHEVIKAIGGGLNIVHLQHSAPLFGLPDLINSPLQKGCGKPYMQLCTG